MMDDEQSKQIRAEFAEAVNMTASQLTSWLDTAESSSVGQKSGSGESVGHGYGRRIVTLLGTKAADLSDDDLAAMQKVTGYVARHSAQRPDKPSPELQDTPWRYSLMNWGHDPLQ